MSTILNMRFSADGISELTGKTFTNNGATFANAGRFGGRSAYFSGSSASIMLNNAISLGTSNFTISFHLKTVTVNTWIGVFGNYFANSVAVFSESGTHYLGTEVGGSVTSQGTIAVTDNNWHHIAVVREGNLLKTYVDGVLNESQSIGISVTFDKLYIGYVGSNGYYKGDVDDMVVVDSALWTANFTPPTNYLINPFKFLARTAQGEIDEYVKSYLKFDTDFTDYSGKIWSSSGVSVSATQSKFGEGSAYFGKNQSFATLSTPSHNDFDFGTGDFTVDWWEYDTNTDGVSNCDRLVIGTNRFLYSPNNTGGSLVVLLYDKDGTSLTIQVGTIVLNVWRHVAIVRKSTNIYVFINGKVVATKTISATLNLATGDVRVGLYSFSTFCGYIDELRISKGIARWDSDFTPKSSAYTIANHYYTYNTGTWVDLGTPADDSALVKLFQNSGSGSMPTQQQLEQLGTGAYRPRRCFWQDTTSLPIPTVKLTAVPKDNLCLPKSLISIDGFEGIDAVNLVSSLGQSKVTSSLLHFDSDFTDISGKVWTATGTPAVSATQSKFGGKSLSLAGSSYLSTPTNDDFNFSSGDFTVDWWEYRTSGVAGAPIFCFYKSNRSTDYGLVIGSHNSDGTSKVFISFDGSTWGVFALSLGTIDLNAWNHFALVRKDGIFYTYKNGSLVSTDSSHTSSAISNTNILNTVIGYQVSVGTPYYFNGYIDEFRVSKGIARWTSTFTPPTAQYVYDYANDTAVKFIVSTDLTTYKTYNFTTAAWETIDHTSLTAVKSSGIDSTLLSTIPRAKWDELTALKSGIAFGFLMSKSATADSCSIDSLAMQVDMKGTWNKAIHGTDYTYGYPRNNMLRVTLLTNGDYKINYSEGVKEI